MHHRRFATFLIGLWMAGSILMIYVGTQSVTNVDAILASIPREGAKIVDKIGVENARLLLRFHATEQTRHFFEIWELVQFPLALLVAAVLYLGTHVNRYIIALCGIMLIVVGFAHFVITPELIYTGRNLDFVPNASHNRIWTLYALYGGLEGLKLVLGSIIAGYLFRFRARKLRPEVDLATAVSR